MDNSKETIEEKVKKIISNNLGVDLEEVTNSALLGIDLGADSLDAVEVIMELEKDFNIQISDNIAEDLKTVQQHIDIVEKLYIEEIKVYSHKEESEGGKDGRL